MKPQRKIALWLEEERGGSPGRRRRLLHLLEETLCHREVDSLQELLYINSLPSRLRGFSSRGGLTELANIMGFVNIKFMAKEQQITQQIVQHQVLVLDCLDNPPIDHGSLHGMVLLP